MLHQTVGLFPQPLTKVEININGISDFFDNVIDKKEKSKTTNQCLDQNVNGSGDLTHYHNNSNVFTIYPELEELHNSILESANFVYRKVMNKKSNLFITNAWFNQCGLNGYQFTHNHTNSVLSGTLYIRTDENTNIEFESSYGDCSFANSLSDNSDLDTENEYGYNFHMNKCFVYVSDGTCLFWPSYMKHGYFNNKTPNRLSLSFNLMPTSVNNLYKPYVA